MESPEARKSKRYWTSVNETFSGTARRMIWLLTLSRSLQRTYGPSSQEHAVLEDMSAFLRVLEEKLSSLAYQSVVLLEASGHTHPQNSMHALPAPSTLYKNMSEDLGRAQEYLINPLNLP